MMQASPDLIPHTQFHKGIWLHPEREHGWYYFMPRKNTNLISNSDFLKTVDEPLRELVQFLHRKNIRTTPSCSGHHISERDLSKIYSGIEEDADLIKNGGLYLSDVQNQKKYFFHQPGYSIPWSRNEFIEKVERYQETGVLGIRTGRRKKKKESLLKLRVDHTRIFEEDGIVFILTNEKGMADLNVWEEITYGVKLIFEEEA